MTRDANYDRAARIKAILDECPDEVSVSMVIIFAIAFRFHVGEGDQDGAETTMHDITNHVTDAINEARDWKPRSH
jgi:hypothetical protein